MFLIILINCFFMIANVQRTTYYSSITKNCAPSWNSLPAAEPAQAQTAARKRSALPGKPSLPDASSAELPR